MSKAILVIDKPTFCSLCMFCKRTNAKDFYGFEEERCLFTNHSIHYDTKPDNRECPLKEVPEKIPKPEIIERDDYDWGYRRGRNDCIEEILGE